MAYITVLYGGYKKVTKSLIYFSPPAKCFSKYVFFNIFHTILSEPLRQVFSLVSILNSQIFFWPFLLLLWAKAIFYEITTSK